MEKYGAKSILGIVLFVKGEPVAEVEFWESRYKREYTDEEIELVKAITDFFYTGLSQGRPLHRRGAAARVGAITRDNTMSDVAIPLDRPNIKPHLFSA